MRPRQSRPTFLLLTATAVFGSACGHARADGRTAAPFTSAARHRLDIGLRENGPREATLGHVMAARVSEHGRFVVVLDFTAPYVKMFDGEGRFLRAFVRTGGGPGEARHPSALAVSGDTSILVADLGGRLMVFGVDGTLRAEALAPRMETVAASAGCAGDWLLYGPRFDGGASIPTRLHRARISASGGLMTEDAVPGSVGAGALPFGVAYGLVSGSRGAAAWHTLGTRDALVRWPCGASAPAVQYRRDGDSERASQPRQVGGATRLEIQPGFHARAGIAEVADGVVIAELVQGKDEDSGTTELTLIGNDGSRKRITVPGHFVLRDSRPGVGVLVSSTDPVPHVFLITQQDLRNLFRS
jgi:hypothetical protein